jgi:hypothetical protein
VLLTDLNSSAFRCGNVPIPPGRVVKFARIILGVGNELGDGFEGQLGIDYQHLRGFSHQDDRRKARCVIACVLGDHRAHDQAARGRHHQRIAIGVGNGRLPGAYRVTGTGLVFDEYVLSKHRG